MSALTDHELKNLLSENEGIELYGRWYEMISYGVRNWRHDPRFMTYNMKSPLQNNSAAYINDALTALKTMGYDISGINNQDERIKMYNSSEPEFIKRAQNVALLYQFGKITGQSNIFGKSSLSDKNTKNPEDFNDIISDQRKELTAALVETIQPQFKALLQESVNELAEYLNLKKLTPGNIVIPEDGKVVRLEGKDKKNTGPSDDGNGFGGR